MPEIQLNKGIHRSPSIPADGQLDICVNLMPKDGELRNVPRLNATDVYLPGTSSLLAVHRVTDNTNHIYSKPESKKQININLSDRTWAVDSALVDDEQVQLDIVYTITVRRTVLSSHSRLTITSDTQETSGSLGLPLAAQSVTDITINENETTIPAIIRYAGNNRPKRIRAKVSGRRSNTYNSLNYQDSSGTDHHIRTLSADISSVDIMGNTLIITADRIYYALWRDNNYVWLGSEFPDVDIQFRLNGEYATTYHQKPLQLDYDPNSQGNRQKVYDKVVTVLNNPTMEYNYAIVPKPAGQDYVCEAGKTYKITFHRQTGGINGVDVRGRTSAYDPQEEIWQDFDSGEYLGWTSYTEHRIHELVFTAAHNYEHLVFRLSSYTGAQMSVTLLEGSDSAAVSFKNLEGDSGEAGYNAIIGIANKFVNDYHRDKAKFIYPFLVRYALRLFDGSFVNLSCPVLMVPNDGLVPVVNSVYDLSNTEDKDPSPDVYCSAVVADLEYKVLNADTLSNWRDIITDVVIGVTPQAYSYNQGAKFDPTDIAVKIRTVKPADSNSNSNSSIIDFHNAGNSYCTIDGISGRWEHSQLFLQHFSDARGFQYILPAFSEDHIKKEITGRGDFHIIKYLKAGEVEAMDNFAVVEMDDGVMTGLEARRTINEDTRNPRQLNATCIKVYNQRLVLGNVTEVEDNGARPVALTSSIGTYVNGVAGSDSAVYQSAVTESSRNGEQHTTVCVERDTTPLSQDFFWAFYPNPDATRMTVYANFGSAETPSWKQAVLQLERHDQIYGSFYYNNMEGVPWEDCESGFDPSSVYIGDTYCETHESGKVIQSNPANPFCFPVSLQSYVTKGDIIALATATKEMSQGQFGQFPIYCFATDGVWALNFDSSGRLSASQPASLEQANNLNAICETDSMVVFTTDRGLRALTGSSVKELAPQMHGHVADSTYGSGHDYLEQQKENYEGLLVLDSRKWIDILRTARIGFDYPNNLLHIYPSPPDTIGAPDVNWHYMLSLDTEEVCVARHKSPVDIVRDMTTDIVTLHEQYTNSGQTQYRTSVYDYQDNRDDSYSYRGFLLTRPTALEQPMQLKTIDDLRVIRTLRDTSTEFVRVAILVSNDRITWHRLPSLRHHSFKWFRFAIYTNMTDASRLDGILIESTLRRDRKIR